MKVSKEKREEIRRSLVAAAVELFTEKGVGETSMREIAARAGVAPGTVYKYFPSRERLFYAYFELKQDDAQAALLRIAEFDQFTFKEKLQAYLESLLDEYVAEREFVAIAVRGLVDSPLQSISALQPVKRKVTDLVEDFFKDAAAKGEISEGLYDGFLVNLLWDYTTVVLLHWLKDDSECYSKTSEFIDLSLDLYVEMVRGRAVEKAAKVISFLLKSHLYGNLDRFLSALSNLTAHSGSGDKEKP
jgi:AcrR family transcriptional regulator